ncbi:hypothetical protein NHX12_022546 [Muraenolepis orangiensis]|uniref:Uncharacterized protein n=1 Tax=Muraenolepis orangiensis TaxID=630683 RepID=A0A9Q0ENH2_9TELE|nr:hypothetical protein NHX12_022546 [Muraenolepis orangiensis]
MLRADRRTPFPEPPSSVDNPGHGPGVPRMTFPAVGLGVKDQGRGWGGSGRRYKSVTMAPTSRYLSDRRYVARRPLVHRTQTSILKKTDAQETWCEEVRGEEV